MSVRVQMREGGSRRRRVLHVLHAAAAVVALVAGAGRAGAQPAVAGADGRPALGCRVDPTVELLSVLMLLGGARHDHPLPDHDYAREALDRFGPYAEHPAVR